MTARSGRVLVFGEDDRSLLAVVRSLGRRGLEVHVAGCPPESHTLRSRYIAKTHIFPPFLEGGREFIDAVCGVLSKQPFDLVLPCNDASILPLAAARHQIGVLTRLYLLDDRTMAIVNDKARSAELARTLGVPLPRELSLPRGSDPTAAIDQMRFPLVLKPVSSFTLDALSEKRYVRTAFSANDCFELARAMLSVSDLVIQEHFAGHGVGVEVLASEGEVLAMFCHERIHEPGTGGGSSYRRSVPADPRLAAATADMCRALNYTGVGMFEYRVNQPQFVFLEINGRMWGSLPLAIAAGADFPSWLYDLLTEGRKSFPGNYRMNLYARNTLNDIWWFRENWNARDKHSRAATGRMLLAESLNVLAGRERNDTLVLDDPMPGIADFAELGYLAKRSAHRRICGTRPARALARRRALRILRRAKRILFVCKGNICRSPFAEVIARERWPDILVSSAGYYPASGRRSPDAAQRAAHQFGVALADHRSRIIDEGAVREADAIIVFDEDNAQALQERFPEAHRKLMKLGVFYTGQDIEDPFDCDLATFISCYDDIKRAIDRATSDRS